MSGHRIIKMNALKDCVTQLGFTNVDTYIQSGNVVFIGGKESASMVNTRLEKAIEKAFGFEVTIQTFTIKEFENIVKDNPFVKSMTHDAACFHVTFLKELPAKAHLSGLNEIEIGEDKFQILGKAVYLFCPNNYSNSKLSNSFIEKKLKVSATTRNWKTANVLLKMALGITLKNITNGQ